MKTSYTSMPVSKQRRHGRMRRRGTKAVGATLTLLTVVLTATPANATPSGEWRCSSLSNGRLCIRYINNYTGVDMRYQKYSGNAVLARFAYVYSGGIRWDAGEFWILANQTMSYAWNYSYPPNSIQGLMRVSGQGDFWAPRITY